MSWLRERSFGSNRWVQVGRGQLWSDQSPSWTQQRFLTATECSRTCDRNLSKNIDREHADAPHLLLWRSLQLRYLTFFTLYGVAWSATHRLVSTLQVQVKLDFSFRDLGLIWGASHKRDMNPSFHGWEPSALPLNHSISLAIGVKT